VDPRLGLWPLAPQKRFFSLLADTEERSRNREETFDCGRGRVKKFPKNHHRRRRQSTKSRCEYFDRAKKIPKPREHSQKGTNAPNGYSEQKLQVHGEHGGEIRKDGIERSQTSEGEKVFGGQEQTVG